MLAVSQQFLDNIKSLYRQVKGKVIVDYTDPFLDQSITVSANENNNISQVSQVANAVSNPTNKYATLDGSWVLDGSFKLAPSTPTSGEVGWWGSSVSGVGGVFSVPYPLLTVQFFARPITKLSVVGDSKRNEYPKDFIIRLYNVSNTLLYTETVTNNALVNWSKNIATVNGVTRMTLEISKWSAANRNVKIYEFFTSVQETYEEDDLVFFSVLEEREFGDGSLPIGNASSNQLELTLNNASHKFDEGNVQSPVYGLLKANRRLKAFLGVVTANGTEWIPMGTYWSLDWSAPEDSVYAHTSARDRLELLRSSTYANSSLEIMRNFPGTLTDYVARYPVINWPTTSITIEFDLRTTDNNCGVFSYSAKTLGAGAVGSDNEVLIYMQADGTLGFGVMISPYVYSVAVANDGVKHHWAFTWRASDNAVTIYRDGLVVNTGTMVPTRTSIVGGGSLYLAHEQDDLNGGLDAGQAMTGDMDNVRVWNTIRTQQEIQDNKDKRLLGTENGLVLCWEFNEGNATVAKDKSSNGNDATIVGTKAIAGDVTLYRLAEEILQDAGLKISENYALNKTTTAIAGATNYNGALSLITNGFYLYTSPYYDLLMPQPDQQAYVQIDLGSVIDINMIKIWHYYGDGRTYHNEQVKVSSDGITWITVYDSNILGEYSETSKGKTHIFETLPVRYIRDYTMGSTANAGNHWVEVQAFNTEYFIDDELKNYVIPFAYFESQSHREALRKIIEACVGQMYCDRSGIVRLEGPSYLTGRTVSVLEITGDDYVAKNYPSKRTEVANSIQIYTSPLILQTNTSEIYRSSDAVSINAGQTKNITITFNAIPCTDIAVSLSGAPSGATITGLNLHCWGADVTVSSPTTAGTFTIVATGRPLVVSNKEKLVLEDSISITDNGKLVYEFPDNHLIQTSTIANTNITKVLAMYKTPRRDLDLSDWRGNPALVLGDRIKAPDNIGGTSEYFVNYQSIEFDGSLKAVTKGRRAT